MYCMIIICVSFGGVLHKVEFDTTRRKIKAIAEQLNNKYFFRRLNTITTSDDAVANMSCITISAGHQ